MKLNSKINLYICRPALRICLILTVSQLMFAQSSTEVKPIGKLEIIITGFNNDDGECWFALDNSESVYEREDSVWIGKILPIINKMVTVVIDSLDWGEYAVRVFHDENSNGKIDTNFLGIPDEDYGYSNDASGWFGPPSWKNAMFTFDKTEMTIKIEVD